MRQVKEFCSSSDSDASREEEIASVGTGLAFEIPDFSGDFPRIPKFPHIWEIDNKSDFVVVPLEATAPFEVAPDRHAPRGPTEAVPL